MHVSSGSRVDKIYNYIIISDVYFIYVTEQIDKNGIYKLYPTKKRGNENKNIFVASIFVKKKLPYYLYIRNAKNNMIKY